jgi:hypothetical protein
VYGGVDGLAAYIDNVQAAYPYSISSNIVLSAPELTGSQNTISIDFKLSVISTTYNNSSFFVFGSFGYMVSCSNTWIASLSSS